MTDKRRTDAEKIIDAIGLVKDEYIEEAHGEVSLGEVAKSTEAAEGLTLVSKPSRKRRKIWYSIGAMAAALLLFVGVGSQMGLFKAKNADLIYEGITEEAAVAEEATEEAIEETAEAAPESAAPAPGPLAPEGEMPATEEGAEEADYAGEAKPSAEDSETNFEFEEEKREEGEEGDTVEYMPPAQQGEAFVLTAGRWKDNDNWPFFVNLVNSGIISFPSFGIDPRNRIEVNVYDLDGETLANEVVRLYSDEGELIWEARTDKEGRAYLFAEEGYAPGYVEVNGESQNLLMIVEDEVAPDDDQQGEPPVAVPTDTLEFYVDPEGEVREDLQVMFIIDTTGSMGDELAYLQSDFSSIAKEIGTEGVSYSVNFYRDMGDEYVVKANGFTDDIDEVVELLNAEYAAGGGDEPEAVADALYETITANSQWRDDCKKIAFLIFDAPPHYGTEDTIRQAIRSAAEQGIVMVPLVASNAERETELFGRAMAICTGGTYVFLTDHSGVGLSHLEPIIGDYDVELLHNIIVDLINEQR